MLYEKRSDLAAEIIKMKKTDEKDGVKTEEYTSNGILINKITVKTDQAAEKIGKPCGVYITVDLSGAFSSDETHQKAVDAIAEQLKEHSITRKYRAICAGIIKEDNGIIDAPIGRDEKDRKKMAVNHKNGKRAVTHYRVLERFKDYTYIECQLETGRTHQIRVHMASIGHPLLGDFVYSSRKWPFSLDGQTLHAYILGFAHPKSGKYIETEAPLPAYFVQLLDKLRKM